MQFVHERNFELKGGKTKPKPLPRQLISELLYRADAEKPESVLLTV